MPPCSYGQSTGGTVIPASVRKRPQAGPARDEQPPHDAATHRSQDGEKQDARHAPDPAGILPWNVFVRWNCGLNLTHTIIQTTQRLYDRERNISFQLVEVADIPKLPQDTDSIFYYPHALRFASKARYQGDNPSGRIWRYWVASEVQGGWPSDPKYWTDQSRNETRTFTRAESKRTYRHRVILEHFGEWGRAWTNAIWVACSLCVFALVYDIWYAVKISAQATFPRRFPGKPVHLLPPSMGDVAVRIAIITVEVLVVIYNFVWVIDFTALVHERVGDLAYADWNVGERFTRASASLKLSTLLVAIPGLAFARKVPKPNQFHITNAIAAAALLIALAYAVESALCSASKA
jgi:hypothetical protein